MSLMMADGENGAESIVLEKALGITSSCNAALATTPSGCIVYAAGCVAVILDPELNQQKAFFKISSLISALCVSPDGKYLAVAARGAEAPIKVFDIASSEEIVELKGHQFGVSSMSFSQDSTILSSCGYKGDKQLLVWNWLSGQSCAGKLGNRVNSVCFSPYGNYFVTCGDRHLKWWTYSKTSEGDVQDLKGHPASIFEAQRYSNFTDCSFGSGSNRHTLFCSTATGGICIFHENKIMDRYVQTECPSAFCINIVNNVLYIGCSDGLCFLYSVPEMILLGNVPLPDAIPRAEALAVTSGKSTQLYPACYAVRAVPNSRNIAIIYADRSLAIWDASDPKRSIKFRVISGHRACIWDIQFLVAPTDRGGGSELSTSILPPLSFVTCSADSTLRFWNADSKLQRQSRWKIPYCKDMLKIVNYDDDSEPQSVGSSVALFNIAKDMPDLEHPLRMQV